MGFGEEKLLRSWESRTRERKEKQGREVYLLGQALTPNGKSAVDNPVTSPSPTFIHMRLWGYSRSKPQTVAVKAVLHNSEVRSSYSSSVSRPSNTSPF